MSAYGTLERLGVDDIVLTLHYETNQVDSCGMKNYTCHTSRVPQLLWVDHMPSLPFLQCCLPLAAVVVGWQGEDKVTMTHRRPDSAFRVSVFVQMRKNGRVHYT